ncbi:hypothetical protein BWQ96_00194 [Gracilariopsis chorda]|uniref:DDE Tnp4 domain-containing protein n=1 Tax=Gracilariopsis chorda TaxID=448386 RepID=A0A2V3J6N7_9FLOR|nr:hypothetical protein BWQ96_00194 [Gracilariopsis chorda]|eukprot:PXF50034.1 hypothetical protein BWQ96_00194 [Gracilariopsis chorda]
MQTVIDAQTKEEKMFARRQEGVRKSVERVFGVLFARFNILKYPGRLHKRADLINVLKACCIIHNMIVEEEKESYSGHGAGGVRLSEEKTIQMESIKMARLETGVAARAFTERLGDTIEPNKSSSDHRRLKKNLMKHITQAY